MKKQPTEQHPTDELLRLHLDRPDPKIQRHLDACHECRLAAKLMQTTSPPHSTYEFSESLIQRLSSVPALADGVPGQPQLARTLADSWAAAPRIPARQAGHGVERRLRFQVTGLSIDLVVDRFGDQVECSLRVSRRGRPLSGFVINVGGHKLMPSDEGFFSWTANTPPTQIVLWSPDCSITTGEIAW